MLREIVIDHQRVHAIIAEILAHHAACIGGDVLQRRRLRGGRGHHNRVIESVVILQRFDDLGDGRTLLADCDIDAIELALLVGTGVDLFLIEDSVDYERSLAGLPIANDQLALATPDRDQRVDGLQPGLDRLVHRAARYDARGLDLDARAGHTRQRTLAVDRLAERIDNATQQPAADRHVDNGARALDDVTLVNSAVITKDDNPDIIALEV